MPPASVTWLTPPGSTAAPPSWPATDAHLNCNKFPRFSAVDTLAGKRDLMLTIPFMARTTVELIQALKFPRKPDVLG